LSNIVERGEGVIIKVNNCYASCVCEAHLRLAISSGAIEKPYRKVDIKKNGLCVGYGIVDLKLSVDQRGSSPYPRVDSVIFMRVTNKITKYGRGHPTLDFFLVNKKTQFEAEVTNVSQFKAAILKMAKKNAALGEIINFVCDVTAGDSETSNA